LALAGCGGTGQVSRPVAGTWDEVVAAANAEGAVTIYSTQAQPVLADLENAFETAYPQIDLTVVRGVDADLLSRIDAESRTGKGAGDIAVITDVSWMQQAEGTDAAVAVVGPAFDAPEYRRADSVVDGKFFLEGAVILGFGWNTTAYPEGIRTARDLLDPALKGKVGIVTPATSPTYIDYYDHIEENYGGRDFLRQLAQNSPRIYPSSQPLGQALASGEIVAALMCNPMLPERAAGAPVAWTEGRPPPYAHPDIPGATAIELDVADSAQVDSAFATVLGDHGRVDVVVHAAGVDDPHSKQRIHEAAEQHRPADVLTHLGDEQWRRILSVNLDGTFYVLRAAVRAMKETGGGAIVTVGSSAAFDTLTGYPHYAASKAGVHALSQSVAKEAAHFGIRVNTVAPGPVDTGMAARTPAHLRAAMADGAARGYATAAELADNILYLASPGAANVIGAVLLSNGGRFTV
jgi:iron(III) transport system substrate-binding protein